MRTLAPSSLPPAGDFELEETSVWSFPIRGNWATHRGDYRGNWPPQVPRNLILRYTAPGDIVLDQMCGSGTTLIECRLLGRHGIGLDVNPRAVAMAQERLRFEAPGRESQTRPSWQRVRRGDARATGLPAASVDLVATHPPYHNIIHYSDPPIEGDLSRADSLEAFLDEMATVAQESFRVLKPGGYASMLVGDIRIRRRQVLLAYRCLERFVRAGFDLQEDIIKTQWNCRGDAKWRNRTLRRDFLLLAHEHLFVLQKPE